MNGKIYELIKTNTGVRQVCDLTPFCLILLLKRLYRNGKNRLVGSSYGIDTLGTILYADEQVLVFKSEDELQISAHHLHTSAQKYNFKPSASKTKRDCVIMISEG
jgi:hypothetical protein